MVFRIEPMHEINLLFFDRQPEQGILESLYRVNDMHRSSSIALSLVVLLHGVVYSCQGDEPGCKPPYQRMLQGEDAEFAAKFKSQYATAHRKEDYSQAIRYAEELYALRLSKQGADHWETIDSRWDVDLLKRAAAMSSEQRSAWRESNEQTQRARQLLDKKQYEAALPLWQERLKVCKQVLGERHPSTASCYNNLAITLRSLRQPADTVIYFKKALEIHQELSGEVHPDTIVCHHNLAEALESTGKPGEATPHFKKALALRIALVGENHLNTANAYSTYGKHLLRTGNGAEAVSQLQKALDIRQQLVGEKDTAVVQAHKDVADAWKSLGEFSKAESHYSKCITLTRELSGDRSIAMVACYNNLAICKKSMGNYTEASLLYRQAIELHRELAGERSAQLPMLYSNLAKNLQQQGKYSEAAPWIHLALNLQRELVGEHHPDTATIYHALAMNLDGQAKYAEALPVHLKVVKLREELLGNRHIDTAISYDSLGMHYSKAESYKEADPFFRKSVNLHRELLGERHVLTARSISNLAVNLTYQSKYQEAQEHHQKAYEIRTTLYGEKYQEVAGSYSNMALNNMGLKKYEQAIEQLQKAIDIHREYYGERHPETITMYVNLATSWHGLGQYKEQYKALQKAAFAYEAARLSMNRTGAERAADDQSSPYLYLAACAARLGLPDQAFAALESYLGRGLLDEMAAVDGSALSSPDEARRSDLVKKLTVMDKEITRILTARQARQEAPSNIQKLLNDRAEIESSLGELAVSLHRRQLASLETIQASLPAGSALICWVNLPKLRDHWVCVLRSKGPLIWEQLAANGPDNEWNKEDRRLPQFFRESILNAKPLSEIEKTANKLFQQRLAPIEKHLAGVKHLVIVPIGSMAGVPIEATCSRYTISYIPSGTILARLHAKPRSPESKNILALGDPVFRVPGQPQPVVDRLPPGGLLITQVTPGGVAAQARLLPGDVLLSYAGTDLTEGKHLAPLVAQHANNKSVTIRVWRETEEKIAVREIAPGKMSVVVAPNSAPEAISSKRQADRLLASLRAIQWNELPGTRVEIAQLKKLVGERVTELTGSEASEHNLLGLVASGKMKNFHYLHLATHGEADTRPFESALILAQDHLPDATRRQSSAPFEDGRLTAREVLETWQLNAELVTLSACESGIGRSGGGDGLLGFSQAFLRAGACAVCLSLWKVDDAATALLMNRFYHNVLVAKLPKSQALSEAKQWLRELSLDEATRMSAEITQGVARGKDAPALKLVVPVEGTNDRSKEVKPFAHPKYWAAFILVGNPN
jgi:CHAT domain-containing protein